MAEPFRYMLTRTVDPLFREDGWRSLLFVMLNPSTANDVLDDPTIRRCRGFAAREKAPLFQVVNLFALRATDPSDLAFAADPVGPRNDEMLRIAMAASAHRVVCAWGAHPFAQRRLGAFAKLHAEAGAPALWCLGTTKAGAPRHPLYVKADQPLVPFAVPGEVCGG